MFFLLKTTQELFRDRAAGSKPEPGVSVRHNLETMAACEMMVRSITERRECFRKELDS